MYQQINYQTEYEIEMNRIRKENKYIEMKKYMNELSKRQNDFNIQCAKINLQLQNCQNQIFMKQPIHSFIYQFPIQQPIQTIQTTSYCEQQSQQEYHHLNQNRQKDINELCKIIYEHIKQTVEELSTKTFLTQDEQEKLNYYKDALDIIHSTQTMQNPNEHILSKLNAILNLTEIVNKHFSRIQPNI